MGHKIGYSRFIAYLYDQETVQEVIAKNFPGAIQPEDTNYNSFTLNGELYCYDRITVEEIELDDCYVIIEVYKWCETDLYPRNFTCL